MEIKKSVKLLKQDLEKSLISVKLKLAQKGIQTLNKALADVNKIIDKNNSMLRLLLAYYGFAKPLQHIDIPCLVANSKINYRCDINIIGVFTKLRSDGRFSFFSGCPRYEYSLYNDNTIQQHNSLLSLKRVLTNMQDEEIINLNRHDFYLLYGYSYVVQASQ